MQYQAKWVLFIRVKNPKENNRNKVNNEQLHT